MGSSFIDGRDDYGRYVGFGVLQVCGGAGAFHVAGAGGIGEGSTWGGAAMPAFITSGRCFEPPQIGRAHV